MSVSDTSKIKVIGVAGGSASGKTTIVNIIREHFGDNLAVLSHDSYYKAHNELNYEERSRLNYDHPDSFETDMMVEHVRMLKKGIPVEVPIYDYSIHNRSQATTLVESILSQYQDTVKPMHEAYIEPSKKYADIIIPRGGQNTSAIELLLSHIDSLLKID